MYITSGSNVDAVSPISTSNIKRGNKISKICVGSVSSCADISSLDITFKRPDPDAIIKADTDTISSYSYAEITLSLSDGSATRRVSVYSTGQISVMPD